MDNSYAPAVASGPPEQVQPVDVHRDRDSRGKVRSGRQANAEMGIPVQSTSPEADYVLWKDSQGALEEDRRFIDAFIEDGLLPDDANGWESNYERLS